MNYLIQKLEFSVIKIIKSELPNFVKVIKGERQHGPNIEVGFMESLLKILFS